MSRIPPAEALPFRQVGTDVRAQVELEHKPLNASWVRKGMDIYIHIHIFILINIYTLISYNKCYMHKYVDTYMLQI